MPTHILAFEGDSRVYWFDGNFSEYEEDKKKRLGADATQPHRIGNRLLTRWGVDAVKRREKPLPSVHRRH